MLVTDGNLLVGVVESDCKAGRKKRLRRRGCATILTDDIGGEGWLSPFGDNQDFAVYNVRDVGIVQGDSVAVFG